MYKAKITHVSEVDQSGQVEVNFEGWVDDELKYPFLTTMSEPEKIEDNMKRIIISLNEKVEIAEDLENKEVEF